MVTEQELINHLHELDESLTSVIEMDRRDEKARATVELAGKLRKAKTEYDEAGKPKAVWALFRQVTDRLLTEVFGVDPNATDEDEDHDFTCTCGSRSADPLVHAYHCNYADHADDPRI